MSLPEPGHNPLPTLGLANGARLIRVSPSTLRERAAAGMRSAEKEVHEPL